MWWTLCDVVTNSDWSIHCRGRGLRTGSYSVSELIRSGNNGSRLSTRRINTLPRSVHNMKTAAMRKAVRVSVMRSHRKDGLLPPPT